MLPRLLKEQEPTLPAWQRAVRDAVNLLIRRTSNTGPTSDRPANPDTGFVYFDTDMHLPVWWDGEWRKADGTAA